MWRTALALVTAAVLLPVTGCGDGPSDGPGDGDPGVPSSAHRPHHDPDADPNLVPAGATGTPALGQPVETMAELTAWVARVTGECDEVSPATDDELAEYLGPVRVAWYGPFVAEWATCGIEPFDKLGLVLFGPGQQRALQEFWSAGLASGELAENPDWAFGNGFAITAGTLGNERLGLHYLWCRPVEARAHTVPADVDGCVYANTGSHH